MKLEANWAGVELTAENESDKKLLDNLWLSLGNSFDKLENDEFNGYDRKKGEFWVTTS